MAAGTCNTSLQQALNEVVTKYADVFAEVVVYEMLDQPDMANVERFFGVCYVVGNCKPTAATVAQFGAMSSGDDAATGHSARRRRWNAA